MAYNWSQRDALQPVFLSGHQGRLRHPLGALGQSTTAGAPAVPDVPGRLSASAYVVASLLGATLGGGLVGYVGARNAEGALTGSLFCASMAALSDGLLLSREDNPAGAALLAIAGLGGLSYTFIRFRTGLR